jgi:hypothetical protein
MPGKRRNVKRIIHTVYEYRPGKWGVKVELECGHTTHVGIGLSKGHRNSRPAIKTGLCMDCALTDTGRGDGR